MTYSYPEIRTFYGLFAQPNSFALPDGAMETANNIIIEDDNVIQKLRGFYSYFTPASGTIRGVFTYSSRIYLVYSDKISYLTISGTAPNEVGSETVLTGDSFTVSGTPRFVEANGNLYFTSDSGVMKVDGSAGKVFKAGAPPALDLDGNFEINTGPIAGNTQVAYRVVFGRRDANQNLIIGSPSDILVLTNARTTGASYTSTGAGPYTVTVTSNNHGLTTGLTVTVTDATNTNANGDFIITVTGTNTFTYSTGANPASGTLTWVTSKIANLEFSIPTEIDSASDGWFWQLYRTSQSSSDSAIPNTDFRLVEEKQITSAEITLGRVTYPDIVDDILVEYSPELYTNENSREGEAQANARPPRCEDLALFNNHVFYINATPRPTFELDVVDVASMSSNDLLSVEGDNSQREYVARTGLGNLNTYTTAISNGGGDILITYTDHGYLDGDTIYISSPVGGSLTAGLYYVTYQSSSTFKIRATLSGANVTYSAVTSLYFQGQTSGRPYKSFTNSGGDLLLDSQDTDITFADDDEIYITEVAGGSLTDGIYYVINASGSTFKISATVGGAAIAFSAVTFAYVQGTTGKNAPFMFVLDQASTSQAARLRITASGIIKAINRDDNSEVYANYISGVQDIPGKMRLTAKDFPASITAANVTGNSSDFASAFFPALGDGSDAEREDENNFVYISKTGEPEAVPVINFIPVGTRGQEIFRGLALRNSVILLKQDGVFKITGDTVTNFTATTLDNTVKVIAANSAAAVNNQVFFLAAEGLYIATDSSVELISRRIENRFETIVGQSTIAANTYGIGYDSNNTFRLCTMLPNESGQKVTYLYNTVNNTWTESDQLFQGGYVGPDNRLYILDSNVIYRERKDGTRLDYTNQNYSVTVVSVASDNLSAVITVGGGYIPMEGDVILKDDIFSRIASVTPTGSDFNVVFRRVTNVEASDTPFLYERIVSTVRFAPYHAGQMGRTKQFAQLQFHTRGPSVTRLIVNFSGQTFAADFVTNWLLEEVNPSGGWGNEPWGLFAWGQSDGIRTLTSTSPAAVIRLFVPIFQQRSTFIQPSFTHQEGGEAIEIQAMSWAIRGYQERVSK